MPKKYDLGVVMSTFQPFTLMDEAALIRAATDCKHVLILRTDSGAAPGAGNPFTGWEITQMVTRILDTFPGRGIGTMYSIPDTVYNKAQWLKTVHDEVKGVLQEQDLSTVLMVNCNSSKDFPQWAHVHTGQIGPSRDELLDMFYTDLHEYLAHTPASVASYITSLREREVSRFLDLGEEHHYFKTYDPRKFDVTMTTTDAVTTCLGHILLVERKFRPGKGLLALPGGFLKPTDWPEVGVLRELKQETRIDVKSHLLHGCMGPLTIFANPKRSRRGRVITLASHVDLDRLGLTELPKVKGADDAKKALWVPFGELPEVMFEDHRQIIDKILGL